MTSRKPSSKQASGSSEDKGYKQEDERKSGDGREEGYDDELYVFERRDEWFRELHTDRRGWLPPDARLQALAQAEKLGKVPLRELDPGGAAPKKGFEIIGGQEVKAELYKTKNPRPNSSFGFAASPVEVRSGAELRGTTLKISLDKELAKGLDPATVRIFRFDEASTEWHIVAKSGASLTGDYAWARLYRPGLYVPIGLPQDPWLLSTILAMRSYGPWLQAAREMKVLQKTLDGICQLILCSNPFSKMRGDAALADKFGLPPFQGGLDAGNICERCTGLDLPLGGLPEVEILDDPVFSSYAPLLPYPWPYFCQEWISTGPNNVNGRIKSLTIHPTNGNIVYAGGADGGVWKSTDGGNTWYVTMTLELSMAIGALGISASNPMVLYAATGENAPGWNPSYPGIGVYKTVDGGIDWDLLAPIASGRCSRVLVHPANPNIVYVAGNAGLHKSINGGASWTNVRTDHLSDALMDPLAPDTIYAGVWNSGVYKSTDGGVTWALLNIGIPAGPGADWIKLAMGLNGANGTKFLVAKMGIDSGQMYKSTNAGASWTAIPGIHQAASYNEWTNMVAVDPNNQNVIIAGGVGLERSSNGGASFTAIGGTHSDHQAFVFDPTNSNTCYMATDAGVYKSTNNGVTWTLSSQGLVAGQLYSIGVAQTLPFVMGGGTQDQGIIKSNGGLAWVDTGAGNEGGFFIVDPNDSNNIYVTPWSTNLRRSTNGGTSWTTILNGLGSPAVSVRHLAVMRGNSKTLLCTGGDQVFQSVDQGANWTSVLTTTGQAMRVAFHQSIPTVCYATTNTGRVYRSAAGGSAGTWSEPYVMSDRPPTGTISAIAVDQLDRNLLYIGYAGYGLAHVFKSFDSGAHWANASGVLPTDALPDVPVSALVINRYNSEVVYVATDIGVFRTRDGGDSWEPFDDGMPRIVTSGLELQRNTNVLYASTMGRGAYKRVL